MVALIILLLLLAVLGGFGFAAHFLWFVLIAALVLWVIGFFVGGIESGGRRRWYGRMVTFGTRSERLRPMLGAGPRPTKV